MRGRRFCWVRAAANGVAMAFLGRHFRRLVAAYHGPEGDTFALDELNPVVARFLPERGAVLEVGCGYGRNLFAVASLGKARLVVGSDVERSELARARERVAALPTTQRATAHVVQQEPFRLPFPDGAFDFLILWQVLEHVFGNPQKQALLSECVRVLKPGGHILVETPNQWFPFDHHDNKLPLVHWLLPMKGREWATHLVRGEKYHPSEYLTLPQCAAMIRRARGVTSLRKVTSVYFAGSYAEAWRGLAGPQAMLKRVLFVVLAPLHAVLVLFGGSADLFMPSIRAVWLVEKTGHTAPAVHAVAAVGGSA
jgi:SAM-dependent methyltransferase